MDASQRVERMYVDHHAAVRDYLMRLCRNTHLAEDLASETFERALRHLGQRDEPVRTPLPWLRTIARNLLTDHYRRAITRREVAAADIEEEVSEEEELAVVETMAEVEVLVAGLTPGQRQVVLLRALHDLDVRQTAAAMGRTPQAVRNLRHKATLRLVSSRAATQGDVP